MKVSSAFRRSAVVAAAALGFATMSAVPALADDGTGANVVPGADGSTTVVTTGSNDMSIKVNAADAAATNITGTVTNNSEKTFKCAGAKGTSGSAGDVTEALIVAQSEDYYRKYTHRELPNLPAGFNVPIAGKITLGNLDLNQLLPLLQGAGDTLGEANGARNDIGTKYSEARVKGHAGLIPTFEIAPGNTHNFDVYLNNPSSGPRTDFNAAAFIMCTDTATKTPYAFTGYEEGTAKPNLHVGGFGSPSLSSPGLPSPGFASQGTSRP